MADSIQNSTGPVSPDAQAGAANNRGLREWGRRALVAADRPLVALALVAVLLYLADLRGVFSSPAGHTVYTVLSVGIDIIFIVDLIGKLLFFGKDWIRSPWFLIDVLSCLPVLNWLYAPLADLEATRIVRPLRLLRVLRTIRLLRTLRRTPVFAEFLRESANTSHGKKFVLALNLAALVVTAALLFVLDQVDREELREFRAEMWGYIDQGVTADQLRELGGSLTPIPHRESIIFETEVDGVLRTVYFSNAIVDARTQRFEFYLVTGALLASGLFIYIMTFQLQEVTFGQLRALLNIALPAQVARHFITHPEAYSEKSRGAATVVFMDFVGFTKTCEAFARDIGALSQHLEKAMDMVVERQLNHDLIIDKFIGDAVMSFRGGPLVEGSPTENARRVVLAALECARVLAEQENPYFSRVKIGGASGDDCLIGAFGTSKRLTYTVLGDAVNLAARLEPASGQCGASNLFCERTHRLCADDPALRWRRWGQLRVPGKEHYANVYEAFDARNGDEFEFIDTFHDALAAFETRRFEEARTLFERADSERDGGDAPSRFYIEWCDELLAIPPDADWRPVRATHK